MANFLNVPSPGYDLSRWIAYNSDYIVGEVIRNHPNVYNYIEKIDRMNGQKNTVERSIGKKRADVAVDFCFQSTQGAHGKLLLLVQTKAGWSVGSPGHRPDDVVGDLDVTEREHRKLNPGYKYIKVIASVRDIYDRDLYSLTGVHLFCKENELNIPILMDI